MKKKFWICNQVNALTGEMLLYGFIGQYDEIDDAAFIADLRLLENQYPTINFRINCGGGDVYKGLAIYNAIRNSKADTHSFIDGIAASMGAVLAISCKTVHISKHARYMTHRVSGFAGGNSDDLRTYATEMDALEDTISEMLANRTGLTKEEAKAKYITTKDRWINANTCLAEKLVDSIYDAEPVAIPENQCDPKELYNAYHRVFNISKPEEKNMKIIALTLGLPENATEAEIEVAIKKMQADKTAAETAVTNAAKASAKAIVDTAILNKQLVEADRAVFEPLAEMNPEAAKNAISKIPHGKRPGDLLNRSSLTTETNTGDEVIDSWEKLAAKDDDFVAEFKKANPAQFKTLHETYLKKPLTA